MIDTIRPLAPILTVSLERNVLLTWTAAQDASGIARYGVWMDNVWLASLPADARSYVVPDVSTDHVFKVVAYDLAGNYVNSVPVGTEPALPSVLMPVPIGENYAAPNNPFAKLILDEQFSGPALDTTRWKPYDGLGHDGNGLRDPKSINVRDGLLVIEATWDGARIHSGNMKHVQDAVYGRYEFRARCDYDPTGTTSGVVLTWPQTPQGGITSIDGENDIWETGHGTLPNRAPFSTYIHTPGSRYGQVSCKHQAPATEWQTMTMDWTERFLRIYRNGQMAAEWTDPKLFPHVPHHLSLQLDAFANRPLPTPVRMQVDYVRIWR